MLGAIRQSDRAKAALACLAALVLALRLLAPAGYMPVLGAQGVIVTLCTGQGAMTVLLDREGGTPVKPHSGAGEHCPFAGGAAPPLLPSLTADLMLPAWAGAFGVIAFALKTGWIARLAAPPPPASGPPPG